MKKLSLLLIGLIGDIQFAVAATTKAEADEAYQKEKFSEAASLYEEILQTQGESADIYYNLGNAYFKLKNTAKAVLNYERALLLNPGDADIRFNLDMARSKTVDKITPTAEVFIVTWYKSLVNMMSEQSWGYVGIFSFILLLIGVSFYIFGNRLWIKKAGFIGAVVFLIVTVCSNIFASEQKAELVDRTGAIVMEPTINVKSTPNESGTDLFVLHEGTKVFIEDNSMKGWKEIRLEGVGRFSDMMGQRGGSTVLTEVPEMFGAEGFLMDRCINHDVFVKAEHMINGFKDYFISHNEVVYDNPSPGNKQGGIILLIHRRLTYLFLFQ